MTDRTILVDTSVWVDYFRHGLSPQAAQLDELLSLGGAAICAPVKAEILSGALSKKDFERLRLLLDAVPLLECPVDAWKRVAEYRFLLSRRGVRASLIDLWIMVAAMENGAMLWTMDKDFLVIQKFIAFDMYDPFR